ncbi:MAG: 4-hydroxythreonine-4-phosphate dehydrogenase PdxA, partial [Bacteroidota bacterium]|nr:4-hydroxythreonine-4-phosphate dehydrogenase PdxA [Bacteroidota bacterium]
MSSKDKKIKVGFSIGDLNGIGGELILKSLCDKHFLELYTPIVYASSKMMHFLSKYFELPISSKNQRTAVPALPHPRSGVTVWEVAVGWRVG